MFIIFRVERRVVSAAIRKYIDFQYYIAEKALTKFLFFSVHIYRSNSTPGF